VVVGLLPAATAVFAVVRVGERPSVLFWAASLAGAACVAVFTLRGGVGRFSAADILLFGALLTGGLGYAEGGRLAREMPGWQVVSWALVLAAPVTVPLTVVLLAVFPHHPAGLPAVAGMAYVAGVSMFLGFFAWYAGMARAGVARAGQVQLAQPLLTLVWSRLFLGEHAGMSTVAAAVGVVVCVLAAQRARVSRDMT
jgi:drug/metabolite transporter (DMT)-like permease